MSDPLDLSYMGVHTVWTNNLGAQSHPSLTSENPFLTSYRKQTSDEAVG